MGQNVCCALCARDFDYTNAMAMQNILDDNIEVLKTIRTKKMTLIWSFGGKINAYNMFSLLSLLICRSSERRKSSRKSRERAQDKCFPHMVTFRFLHSCYKNMMIDLLMLSS